tara:strand:- start:21 stop:203 length:183 start_codon:yes stop_codon:yes gene_type:complete
MTLDGLIGTAVTGVVALTAMKMMQDAVGQKKKKQVKVQTMMKDANKKLKYKQSDSFSFKI